jgi:hypothetical protein
LLDAKGQIYEEASLKALDSVTAADAARHALSGQGEALKPLMDKWKILAEKEAESRAEQLRLHVQKTMSQALGREMERALDLQKKNGKSGASEMTLLEQEQAALAHSIKESRLRLDAVRLIRVT